MKEIIGFGEKRIDGVYNGFIQYEDGTLSPCSEGMVSSLWDKWVISGTAKRADYNGFSVFANKNHHQEGSELLDKIRGYIDDLK